MRYVRPQFGVDIAIQRFTNTRFKRIKSAFGRQPAAPLRVELIYLPHYAITIPVHQGDAKSAVYAAIEAYSGAFGLQQYKDELLADASTQPGDSFAPRITEHDAIALAREGIIRNALRARGGRRKFRWNDPESVELLQHPFWVYYYARRRGLIDIRLLDAVTGDKPGTKTKAAVLDAFIDAGRKTQPNQVEQHSS